MSIIKNKNYHDKIKKSEVCIILPMHLYQYDIQGDLRYKDKIEMYRFSILETIKSSRGIKVIVVAHGIKTILFKKNYKNLKIIWSKYYKEPNQYGLFDNNPAQRGIVYEGLKYAKKNNYKYIIKGRADSVIRNIDPIIKSLNQYPNKYIFTQQTSFIEPWQLGDCFMAGKIENILKLWSPSKNYHQDGLIYFAKKLMMIENNKNFFKILHKKSIFFDLTKLQIVDFRFNWKTKKHWEKKWRQDHTIILWGVKNKWIEVKNNKIIKAYSPNTLTEDTLNSYFIDNKCIRKIIVFYRKLLKLLLGTELYKS